MLNRDCLDRGSRVQCRDRRPGRGLGRWMGHRLGRLRRSHRVIATTALFSLLVFFPRVAPALVVFHSARDNGIPSAPAVINNGATLVPVYFDNGGTVGIAPCTTLGGAEICQWAARFDTTGDLVIVDIDWNSETVEDDEPTIPAVVRAGTGGNATSGNLGPTPLATVSVIGTYGDLRLFTPAGGGFVDKDGTVLTVDPLGELVAQAAQLPFQQIAVQEDHLCAVLGNGELECWGTPFSGSPSPPAGSYTQVAVSNDGACAIASDGSVACWGPVGGSPSGSFYYDIVAGDNHFCGLLENLELDCFGSFSFGGTIESGPFTRLSRGYDHVCVIDLASGVRCFGGQATPFAGVPPAGLTFINVAGGSGHSCGIQGDGSVDCWGSNSSGQRDGHPTTGIWTGIAVSEDYSCAIENTGEVTCWGASIATPPAGPFRQLTAAADWVCAVHEDGTAECWDPVTMTAVPELPEVPYPQLATSGNHSCDIGIDEAVDCWGSGAGIVSPPAGALTHLDLGKSNGCAAAIGGAVSCWGDDTDAKSTPGATLYSHISLSHLNGCGIAPDGTIDCWGTNTTNGIDSPADPGDSFLQFDGGGGHYCGVVSLGDAVPDIGNNSVECWGDNTFLQGTPPIADFVQVSSGTHHTCGLERGGAVRCWGSNSDLQVAPVPAGIFVEVTAGRTHSCARRAGGSAECWGRVTDGESSPPAGVQFAAISAGGSDLATAEAHSCGLTKEGAIVCWGGNADSAPAEPTLDSDLDGSEDVADNCAMAENGQFAGTCVYPSTDSGLDSTTGSIGAACTSSTTCTLVPGGVCSLAQLDGDGDGVGDACDNSLTLANFNQFNRDIDSFGAPDPDAWGDAFDNCPEIFQTDQADLDMDGLGDACAPAIFRAESGSGSPLAGFARLIAVGDAYQLRLTCPATPINHLELAVTFPSGVDPTSADVGPGCDDTPVSVPLGTGCPSGSIVGQSVDEAESFAIYPNTHGAPADTLYVHFQGKLTDDALCAPLEEVFLANIEVDTIPDGSIPGISEIGLGIIAGNLAWFDGVSFRDTSSPDPLPFATYVLASGPSDADLDFILQPAPGSDGTLWQVIVDSVEEMHEITLGVEVAGADFGDIEWLDCQSSSFPIAGDCLGGQGLLGPYVDPAAGKSFAVGPEPLGTPGLFPKPGVLWVHLQGKQPILGELDALNFANDAIPLGIIKIHDGLPLHVAPTLTIDGSDTIAAIVQGAPGAAFVRSDQMPVDLNSYNLAANGQSPNDSDGDNNPNATDNCDHVVNPDQTDSGGLLTSAPNDTGDPCECGEASDDGQLFPDDVPALQTALANGSTDVTAATEKGARCSVSKSDDPTKEDEECDILDVVTLELATAGGPEAVEAFCLRQKDPNG